MPGSEAMTTVSFMRAPFSTNRVKREFHFRLVASKPAGRTYFKGLTCMRRTYFSFFTS